jgi:hypothetical protein
MKSFVCDTVEHLLPDVLPDEDIWNKPAAANKINILQILLAHDLYRMR